MKINLLLFIVFFSVIVFAVTFIGSERIGGTQLNGNGCVCHSTEESPDVQVWIEGPDTMSAGQSANYRMYMFGGPAVAGGYNVAVHFGSLALTDSLSLLIDNELTQSIPLPFNSIDDTIFWEFNYTAPYSTEFDTLYSIGLSTNWDSIPDDRDQWAYGNKFTVRVIDNIVPVELSSFNADFIDSKVILTWLTASEKNNKGFLIERKVLNSLSSNSKIEFETIGFVEGKGSSTQLQYYSYSDEKISTGMYRYRLKQIDFDGKFSYSPEVEVAINSNPTEFKLFQNYPNPFNPTTKIRFTIPLVIFQQSQFVKRVTLRIYDIIGNEVAVLLDEYKAAGNYEIEFNGSSLPTGIYFYQLTLENFKAVKKMLLVR